MLAGVFLTYLYINQSCVSLLFDAGVSPHQAQLEKVAIRGGEKSKKPEYVRIQHVHRLTADITCMCMHTLIPIPRVSFRKCHKGGQNRPYRIFEGATTIIINITQFSRGARAFQGGANAPPP